MGVGALEQGGTLKPVVGNAKANVMALQNVHALDGFGPCFVFDGYTISVHIYGLPDL